MEINRSAPLVADHQITIQTSKSVVWSLLTDIDRWPQWHDGITRAHLEGPLVPGSQFRWTSGGTAIVSTLQTVVPEQEFGWTGTALGTTTAHLWVLKETDAGTLVTTNESMSGWLIRAVKLIMPTFLDDALVSWLTALKQSAEANS